jgi:hypothetical protein
MAFIDPHRGDGFWCGDALRSIRGTRPPPVSFDQYRNFEIRGARFRDLVTALPGVKPVV